MEDYGTLYEFVAMVKNGPNGSWTPAGTASECKIDEVAGLVQCVDHEHFSYACPYCLSSRQFLKTLSINGHVSRVEYDEYGRWTMEIAHAVETEYLA